MVVLERRRLSRITPYELAFIGIGPENGGIVLNVSAEGLCFESAARVERSLPFHFSLTDHNDAHTSIGEIMWIDETSKLGGIRFTSLTRKDRRQMDHLLTDPVVFNCENNASTKIVRPLADEASQAPEVKDKGVATLPHVVNTTAPQTVPKSQEHSISDLVLSHKETSRRNTIIVRTDSSEISVRSMPRARTKQGWFLVGLSITVVILAVVTSTLIGRSIHRAGLTAGQPARQRVATGPELHARRTLSVPLPATIKAPVAKRSELTRKPQPARSKTSTESVETFGAAFAGKALARTGSAEESERMSINAAPEKFRYPIAPSRTLTGGVRVKILIDSDGSVENVRVLSGNIVLANATVQAVRHWRYRPLRSNGVPIKAQAYVTATFMGDEVVSINFYK